MPTLVQRIVSLASRIAIEFKTGIYQKLGQANGIATLGADGKLTSAQRPPGIGNLTPIPYQAAPSLTSLRDALVDAGVMLPIPSYVISGNITGDILAGVTLELRDNGTNALVASVVSNALGYYEFASQLTGTYKVVPSLAQHTFNPRDVTVNLTANATVNFAAMYVALPAPLSVGLIAWWKMDAKIGTTIRNAANPALYNLYSTDTIVPGGLYGNALQSSTGNTLLDNSYAAFRIDQDFTWQCWTKRAIKTQTSLFRISSNVYGAADLAVKFYNISNDYFLELQHSTFSPHVTTFPVAFTPNIWEAVVITHSTSSKIFTVYFNGVYVGSVPYSNLNLFVHSMAIFGADASGANGMMNEYGYWHRILTPSQVLDLYNGGAGYTV